jgi:hypothetical protein
VGVLIVGYNLVGYLMLGYNLIFMNFCVLLLDLCGGL